MNPLLTGATILTEASISLDRASVPDTLQQGDYQFAIVDWAWHMGQGGAVTMSTQLRNELKIIWNNLEVEGSGAKLQSVADQVWDTIQKTERQAYFKEHVVPDDYNELVRQHLETWTPDAKKKSISIAHWPKNSDGQRYFDSAMVDKSQFPHPGDPKRLEHVLDAKRQLEHWGRCRFWLQVSKENFAEVKRWIMQGDIPEGVDV